MTSLAFIEERVLELNTNPVSVLVTYNNNEKILKIEGVLTQSRDWRSSFGCNYLIKQALCVHLAGKN